MCTGGELAVALSVGFPPERITLHGNNKSAAELDQAVEAGVGRIVVDSFEEIARLGYLAERHGRRPKVQIRVTVGVEAHTHEFIATAHEDQKFGLSLAAGPPPRPCAGCSRCPRWSSSGSTRTSARRSSTPPGFEVAARRVATLLVQIRDEHGVVLPELDLGGGYGIAYTSRATRPADSRRSPTALREIVATVCDGRRAAGAAAVRGARPRHRRARRRSRSTRSGTVKDVEGLRTYVSVDGGMSDNVRTALYGAEYTARAGLPRERRRARCSAASSASTARAATSWCGTASCPPTSPPAT